MVVLVLLIVALAATACGGDDRSVSNWLDLLRHVPNTEETRGSLVTMNDYAGVRQQFDITFPDLDADAQMLTDYGLRLAFGDETTSTGLRGTEFTTFSVEAPGEWRREVGFTLANVDQEVAAGVPPTTYTVLRGRFDHNVIDQAVRTDPLFSDLLEEASHSGVDYYTWGDDFAQDYTRTSVVRRLGRGHRLALRDDYLYWSMWTEGVEGMIDAGLGMGPSLADVDELRLLAEALDSLNTTSAAFLGDTRSNDAVLLLHPILADGDGDLGEGGDSAADETALVPYIAAAAGGGVEGSGYFEAVALVHAEEESAELNAERMKRRLAEGTQVRSGEAWRDLIRDSEVSVRGRVIVAKMRPAEG
jgi:hypothetical protein